jgi:hypothetical protein
MIKVLNILEHWALPVALFNLTVFIFVDAIIKLLEVVLRLDRSNHRIIGAGSVNELLLNE